MAGEYFLTTDRIGFSKWQQEDIELARLLWGDQDVTRYICASGHFSEKEIEAWLAQEIENDKKYHVQYWPVFEIESGELIGCCGLRPYGEKNYEIGIHLRPVFWGRGFASEAAGAVIDYAFHVIKAQRLFAGHHPENKASRRMLPKLGFSYIGKEFYEPTGLYHPSYERLNTDLDDSAKELSDRRNAVLYIHGKGGSYLEAEQYKKNCPGFDVIGIDYEVDVPWVVEDKIRQAYDEADKRYQRIVIIASSIGAYFAMHTLQKKHIEMALFISPIVDMEKLILDMMSWAGVSEDELAGKGEIPTDFGETLSWEYLCFVRENPICWEIPTEILYGEKDNLTSHDTIEQFVNCHNARLTVMKEGEHWFHTKEQLAFLDRWMKNIMLEEKKDLRNAFKIRTADRNDYVRVRDFYDSLIDAMEDAEYKPGWERNVYPTQEFLIHSIKNQHLYIGELDGNIAACMVVNHEYNDGYQKVSWSVKAKDSELFVIHALGVHPDYSGKGIAKQMVRKVIKTACQQKIKTIRLDVLDGNIPAERVYTKMGFTYCGTVTMFYEDTGWTDYRLFEYIVQNREEC